MEQKTRVAVVRCLFVATLAVAGCAGHAGRKGPGVFETKDIAEVLAESLE